MQEKKLVLNGITLLSIQNVTDLFKVEELEARLEMAAITNPSPPRHGN